MGEEGVEVRLEQLDERIVAELAEPRVDQLEVLPLPAGHVLLLRSRPAVRGQGHRAFGPLGPASLAVGERRHDLGHHPRGELPLIPRRLRRAASLHGLHRIGL